MPFPSYGKTELKILKFSTIEGWQVRGDVFVHNANTEIKARKGRIIKHFPLTPSRNEFIVLQAELKTEGVVLGERTHEAPTLILEVSGKNKQRSVHWIRSIGKDWRTVSVVVRRPRKADRLTVTIRNSARAGKIILKKIRVWSANKNELPDFDYPVKWASKLKDENVISVTLQLTGQKIYPLNKKLYGFNSRYSLTETPILKLLNHPKVKAVEPFFVRFPGGTIANFYHWDCDCLIPSELSSFPAFRESLWQQKLFDMLSKPKSFDRTAVTSWCAEKDIGLSLVLNPLPEYDGKYLGEFINNVESTGCRIELLELGNELYDKNQRGDSMPNPRDYFSYVKGLTPYLKRNFPKLPIGLPFSSNDWKWNKALSKAQITYDGIILHLYVPSSSIASIEEDQYILDFSQKTVPFLLDRLRELAPGKLFWVTEWGILDRPLFRRNNTHIGTLFSANMLLTLIREKDVEAAAFHALFSPNFGVFRFPHEAKGEMFNDETLISKQYPFWKKMRQIFSDYPETSQVKVGTGGDTMLKSEINVQLFKNDRQRAVVIVNNSTKKLSVELEELDIGNFLISTRFNHPDITSNFKMPIHTIPPLSILILETEINGLGSRSTKQGLLQ